MGRPVKRYLKRLRDPGRMICPHTGEIVELFGPPKPIYEWRESRRGRPPVSDADALLRIIKAHQCTGQRGFAHDVAVREPHRTEAAVKQEFTRARRQMRRRAEDMTGE